MDGIGSQLLGMIGGHQQERRNYRNNRNLMNLQMQNQAGLNRQGHDLQMDMWNKTNYGAQVGHMKNAGLNPALMYKGAGAGGTTGSQTGGSASMGSSQQGKVMDMSNLLMGAQIKDLEANARLKNVDADKKAGVDTDQGNQNIAESKTRQALNEANVNLTNEQIKQVDANIKKMEADTNLTKKIQEMDYGGEFGKNMTQNIMNILTGEAGLDLNDYIGIATGIGGLSILRSGKLMGKGMSKAKEAVTKTIDKLKARLKGKKPKGNNFDFKKQQDYFDDIWKRNKMGIDR